MHNPSAPAAEELTFFAGEMKEKAYEILSRYPHPKAAVMPLLWLVQDRYGFIPREAVPDVALLTETTPIHVEAIVKFYELFHDHPVGRFQLMLCTNISCLLCGADRTLKKLEELLGIDVGQTTADGLFTLEEFECLAACDKAPVLLVNCWDLYEKVTPERAEEIILQLRRKREAQGPKEGKGQDE